MPPIRPRLPEPYWKSPCGNHVLYRGDCLKILPLLGKVDAVVTDPPYGISLNTDNSRFSGGTAGNMAKRGNGIGSANGKPIIGDDKPFDPSPFLIGKQHLFWGWNNYANKLPRGTCLVWLKRNDEAFGSFLSDAEVAWFSKGHGVYCFKDLSNNSIANNRVHPTQKPLLLMEWCVGKVDGQTILDPFTGSGTTGVACIRLGRKFTGIEIEEKYCKIAADRMQKEWDRMERLRLAEEAHKGRSENSLFQ